MIYLHNVSLSALTKFDLEQPLTYCMSGRSGRVAVAGRARNGATAIFAGDCVLFFW
eukprot:m.229146 g.229146  ORF g.229146 m.229146 type:complete len:56 (+) comp15676_c0_seq1:1373-1540(+)